MQRRAGEPELRAPARRQGGHALQRFLCGRLTAAVAMDGLIPQDAVVLIGIEFQRVQEECFRFRVVFSLGVNLREIREDDAVFAVLGGMILKDLFRTVELAFLHEDKAPHASAAEVIVVDLVELLRGIDDIGTEAVVKRREDHVVKLVGLVPRFEEVGLEHVVAPCLPGDEQLASGAIEDADHVRILRRVRGWCRWRGCRRFGRVLLPPK